MKKIKMFSVLAIVLLVAMFMAPLIWAADKEIKVPEYNRGDTSSQVTYSALFEGEYLYN